jgi:hypothetical protein
MQLLAIKKSTSIPQFYLHLRQVKKTVFLLVERVSNSQGPCNLHIKSILRAAINVGFCGTLQNYITNAYDQAASAIQRQVPRCSCSTLQCLQLENEPSSFNVLS